MRLASWDLLVRDAPEGAPRHEGIEGRSTMDGASLYILRCADGKLYTGLTRRGVDERVSEHQQGMSAFTKRRRPVTLIFSERYLAITDAIDAERRIKGWTRAKKLAYVAGDFERLSELARRGGGAGAGGRSAW